MSTTPSVGAFAIIPSNNLTAAMRVFILGYFRSAATPEGHVRAGHGLDGER